MTANTTKRDATLRRPRLEPLVWIAVCSLVAPADAHAYLDPGTGSLIIQALIGAALALRLTSKMWYQQCKHFVLGLFRPNAAQQNNPPPNSGE